jgi:hypothetical protein
MRMVGWINLIMITYGMLMMMVASVAPAAATTLTSLPIHAGFTFSGTDRSACYIRNNGSMICFPSSVASTGQWAYVAFLPRINQSYLPTYNLTYLYSISSITVIIVLLYRSPPSLLNVNWVSGNR